MNFGISSQSGEFPLNNNFTKKIFFISYLTLKLSGKNQLSLKLSAKNLNLKFWSIGTIGHLKFKNFPMRPQN